MLQNRTGYMPASTQTTPVISGNDQIVQLLATNRPGQKVSVRDLLVLINIW